MASIGTGSAAKWLNCFLFTWRWNVSLSELTRSTFPKWHQTEDTEWHQTEDTRHESGVSMSPFPRWCYCSPWHQTRAHQTPDRDTRHQSTHHDTRHEPGRQSRCSHCCHSSCSRHRADGNLDLIFGIWKKDQNKKSGGWDDLHKDWNQDIRLLTPASASNPQYNFGEFEEKKLRFAQG